MCKNNQKLIDFSMFSTAEQAILWKILKAGASPKALKELSKARRRAVKRAASDKVTDRKRRILVGARIGREQAERYRKDAEQRGMSLYRYVVTALEQMCDKSDNFGWD